MSYWFELKSGKPIYLEGTQTVSAILPDNTTKVFQTRVLWEKQMDLETWTVSDKISVFQGEQFNESQTQEIFDPDENTATCIVEINNKEWKGVFKLEGPTWNWTSSQGTMIIPDGPMKCLTQFKDNQIIQTQETSKLKARGEFILIDKLTYIQKLKDYSA